MAGLLRALNTAANAGPEAAAETGTAFILRSGVEALGLTADATAGALFGWAIGRGVDYLIGPTSAVTRFLLKTGAVAIVTAPLAFLVPPTARFRTSAVFMVSAMASSGQLTELQLQRIRANSNARIPNTHQTTPPPPTTGNVPAPHPQVPPPRPPAPMVHRPGAPRRVRTPVPTHVATGPAPPPKPSISNPGGAPLVDTTPPGSQPTGTPKPGDTPIRVGTTSIPAYKVVQDLTYIAEQFKYLNVNNVRYPTGEQKGWAVEWNLGATALAAQAPIIYRTAANAAGPAVWNKASIISRDILTAARTGTLA